MDRNSEHLTRIARLIGRCLGVEIGVDYHVGSDRYVFVDDADDPITHDGQLLLAATPDEMSRGDVLEVPVRALRAAGVAKMQEIERLDSPTITGAPEAGPGPHL